MKRPILIITIGFIIGIILGLYFKIGIALIFLILFFKNIKKSVIILLISSTIVSYVYISYLENQYETKFIDTKSIHGQAIVISGGEDKEYYSSYIISYNENNLILYTKSKLNYGDLIEFNGEFQLPKKQKNFGGFDYREYLKTKKIYGIVKSNKIKVVENNKINNVSSFIYSIQNKIKNTIHTLDKENTGDLLVGLLLGDKDSVSEDVQTVFKNSGLSHLLAVSGLHVNYFVMAIIWFVSKLKINKRLTCSITIIFLIFFMYLTNFTESVVRAGIMGIVVLGAQIFYRKQDTKTSVALSLLIILLENPYKLFSIGLQLSFAGTISILYFYPKLKGKVNDIVAVCISAQILIIPVILINFNMFSTYFLIANILVSPLIGIVIISGFVFVSISFISLKLSLVIYLPLKILLKILLFINYFISSLPYSTFLVKTPYLFNVIFFYIAIFHNNILNLLMPELNGKVKKYYIKILCFILIVLLIITAILDNLHEFNIYFVDVGQGDCTLIRTKFNKTILIDGGGSEDYDVGKNVLIPYLLDRRISKIDYMIISHFDTDHVRRTFNCDGRIKG